MILDFGGGPRLSGLAQMFDDRGKQDRSAFCQIIVHCGERGFDGLHGLPGIEQLGVNDPEETRVQLQCLWEHFAVGQKAGFQHFDPGQRVGRVENPQRRVVQIAARQKPFMGLVDGGQSPGCRREELHLVVALADAAEIGAQGGDALIVRVEQTSLGEERVEERVAHGAFQGLAKLGSRH